MQLDQLEFVVKTEQLDTAITKIRKLGEEVSKLPKGGLGGLPTGGGGTRGAGRDVEDYEKKLEKLREQLKFLRNDQELSNLGFTKMQAGMLAAIKVAGAGEKTIASFAIEFDKLNKITGQNPFDKSSQGLKKLENDLREIEEVTKYTAQGFKLTSDQVKALSRDLEAMRQRNEALNASDQEISRLQKEHILLFAQKADQLNKYNAEAARSTAAAKTLANADAKLLEQEQKLAFTNKQLADGLSQGSANALYNYKKQIEALGLSTEQAAKRVASFREQLVIKQGYSPLAKLSKDTEETSKKLDHLSRALGPQITDIFVGLATGQSLLTVALQQGGQIRDQIALSGIASAEAGMALSRAATTMVASLKDTSTAIGSLLITPFIAAGKAMSDFGLYIVGATNKYKLLRAELAMAEDSGNRLATFTYRLLGSIPTILGSIVAGFVAFGVASAVAFFAVEKQVKALTTNLILTGGSLGVTTDAAIRMAESMESVGISSFKALGVMTEMAKQGGFTSKEIELVTKSAVQMQAELGVSVEDTVKQFAKLKEDPVNALLKVAEQTGLVSTEVLATVISLDQQGKTADATALAMQAYGDVTVTQVQRAKQEYTEFAQLMIDIGKGLGKFWDSMKEMWISASPSNQLAQRIEYLNASINSFGIGSDYKKKLEEERTELQKKLILLQDVNFAEDQKNKMQSASAKVLAEAKKTTEQYLTGLQKLSNERVKAKNEQEELNAQFKRGAIDQIAYDAMTAANKIKLAKIDDDIAKENKKNNAESVSAAKKHQDELKKAINVYEDIVGISGGVTKSYNEQVAALIMLGKEGKKSPEQIAEAFGKLEEQQPRFKALVKDFEDYDKAIQAHLGVMKEYKDLNSESSAQLKFRASLLGKTAEEQRSLTIENEKSVALLKAQVKYQKDLKALTDSGLGGLDLETAKINLTKEYETQRTLIAKDANLKIAEDYLDKFEAIQKELGNIMFLALTNRGAKAGKNLRALITAELMKPINVVINAVINTIFGDAINSILQMLGVKGPSAAGSLVSAAGLYKTGSDVYSAATGGFAKAGTAASALTERFATSALGQKLGLSSVQSLNVPVFEAGASSASGTTMVSNNAANQTVMTESGQSLTSGIGNLATSITATLVGQALRKAISNGYKMSKGLENVSNIAGIVAGFDKTGFSQIVVGVVSGLASRAFGTKLTQSGIQGTFGGEQGFTGSRYTFEKGGWFRSDKERMQPLEQELQSGLALAFNVTKFEVQKFTDYMGVGADAIANFSYKMKLNLKGLSEADAIKAIDTEFTKVKESMAKAVLAGKSYGKVNETYYQTLERLATTVYSVNSIFKDLGANVLDVGYAGVDTALMFTEYFEGIDKFNSSLGKFYNEFYTEAEKTANLTRNTTEAFNALGLALPSSKEAFKALVQSAINAGNPQLLAGLLNLQDAFILLGENFHEAYVRLKKIPTLSAEDVAKQRIGLEQRLFEATATQAEIQAKARSEIDDFNKSLYDVVLAAEKAKIFIAPLGSSIMDAYVSLKYSAATAEDVAKQRIDLEQRLFVATATQAQIQAKARAEIDSYNLSLYDQVLAIESSDLAISAAYARLKSTALTAEAIANQKISLEQRLFDATATQVEIQAKARAEIDSYNLSLYDQVIAAEKAKVVLEQRKALQDEYFNLTASQTEIAAKARSAIDASNLAIYDMVEAVKAAKAAEEERLALQNRLFEATATQSEIQAKARSEINDSNKALYDQVLAAEEASNASKQLADTMQQLADSIINEVNRLKGAILGDVGVSGGVSGLTSEFVTLTAQARAGDMKAIEKLPEYSQAIEQAVASTAANASDVVYARAWLAASLGNTADVISGADTSMQPTALTSLAASTVTNGASVISTSATSQSELIAILVAEIQGLRAEVRADVSANTKTSKILERANQDGESLNVTVI